jgi:hypothetical protein
LEREGHGGSLFCSSVVGFGAGTGGSCDGGGDWVAAVVVMIGLFFPVEDITVVDDLRLGEGLGLVEGKKSYLHTSTTSTPSPSSNN